MSERRRESPILDDLLFYMIHIGGQLYSVLLIAPLSGSGATGTITNQTCPLAPIATSESETCSVSCSKTLWSRTLKFIAC